MHFLIPRRVQDFYVGLTEIQGENVSVCFYFGSSSQRLVFHVDGQGSCVAYTNTTSCAAGWSANTSTVTWTSDLALSQLPGDSFWAGIAWTPETNGTACTTGVCANVAAAANATWKDGNFIVQVYDVALASGCSHDSYALTFTKVSTPQPWSSPLCRLPCCYSSFIPCSRRLQGTSTKTLFFWRH
jgi:hypothetical protein